MVLSLPADDPHGPFDFPKCTSTFFATNNAPTNISDEVVFLQNTFREFWWLCVLAGFVVVMLFCFWAAARLSKSLMQPFANALALLQCVLALEESPSLPQPEPTSPKSPVKPCSPLTTTPPVPTSLTSCAVHHLAVIMDGNRRFGRSKFGNATRGHREGGHTLVKFIDWCKDAGVKVLTVYAFSTENWKRDPAEVNALMSIFEEFSEKIHKEALAKNIKVRFLSSDAHLLPQHIQTMVHNIERATAHCDSFQLNVCLSYGSRGEIVNACKAVVQAVQKGELDEARITEEVFGSYLLTNDTPCPDLVIRTSGECRLSNFLLYQLAYAEMIFLDKHWPELTQQDLLEVLDNFAHRNRRYGK